MTSPLKSPLSLQKLKFFNFQTKNFFLIFSRADMSAPSTPNKCTRRWISVWPRQLTILSPECRNSSSGFGIFSKKNSTQYSIYKKIWKIYGLCRVEFSASNVAKITCLVRRMEILRKSGFSRVDFIQKRGWPIG